MTNLVERAAAFAERAHCNQRRRYTGEPYFVHCATVAALAAQAGLSDEAVAAAYLHDVVEDTPVTHDEVLAEFGPVVSYLVLCLTDVDKACGNRATRKALDRERLAHASPEAQSLKLADVTDNAPSILAHDPKFAKVFLAEARQLLGALTKGDPRLFALASKSVATH